eukprot:2004928-Pyramimonas_sp.AAC.2
MYRYCGHCWRIWQTRPCSRWGCLRNVTTMGVEQSFLENDGRVAYAGCGLLCCVLPPGPGSGYAYGTVSRRA